MKYIISIPEPCNEDWNKMTPTEKGRYCAVCEREIYDFTQLTHKELADKLRKNEDVCAMFRKDQLDVDLYAGLDINLSKIAMAATVTTVMATSQPALAQNTNIQSKTEQVAQDSIKKTIETPSDSKQLVITGAVTEEETGETLPGVNVIVKGSDIGTSTDFDGLFELRYTPKDNRSVVLVFSYIGYEDKVVKIKKADMDKALKIGLKVELKVNMLVGTMGLVVVKRRNIFQRTGDFFKRLFTRKKKASKSCEVK